jgi:hypothetical protein
MCGDSNLSCSALIISPGLVVVALDVKSKAGMTSYHRIICLLVERKRFYIHDIATSLTTKDGYKCINNITLDHDYNWYRNRTSIDNPQHKQCCTDRNTDD